MASSGSKPSMAWVEAHTFAHRASLASKDRRHDSKAASVAVRVGEDPMAAVSMEAHRAGLAVAVDVVVVATAEAITGSHELRCETG